MKTSVNFRFGLSVFLTTVWIVGMAIALIRNWDTLLFCFMMFPSCTGILGRNWKGWHESDREISNRTLIIGFIALLLLVWVGGITLAHYFTPEGHFSKFVIWTFVGVFWLVANVRAYQWWRAVKTVTTAAST